MIADSDIIRGKRFARALDAISLLENPRQKDMPYEKKGRGTRPVAVQCAIGTLIPTCCFEHEADSGRCN